MRALHTAATGMMAQELNVQVISNNIANMRTTGYKRQRAEFQDLLYEHVRRVGTQTSDQGNILPAGIELGGGVKTVGTPRLMTPGHAVADRQRSRRRDPRRRLLQDPDARRPLPPIRATARSSWTRRAASSPRRAMSVQPGHHDPAERHAAHHQRAGPGLGDAAGLDHADHGRPDRADDASSTRPACRRSATTCSSNAGLRHAAGRHRQHRRLRRPAAGQSRTGQRRGGDRNLRPDRRAARLRDERQGHHRRRPDAAVHLQDAALRTCHDRPLAPARHRARSRLPLRRASRRAAATRIATPALRAAVTVTGDIVRIGDIIDNAGAAAQIADLPRARSRHRPARCRWRSVLDALRAHQVIGVDTRDLREVSVTRLAARIDGKEIEQQRRPRAGAQATARRRRQSQPHLRSRCPAISARCRQLRRAAADAP